MIFYSEVLTAYRKNLKPSNLSVCIMKKWPFYKIIKMLTKHYILCNIKIFTNHPYMIHSYLTLGPPLPELEVDDLLNEEKRQQIITVLDERIKKKNELRDLLIKQSMLWSIYVLFIIYRAFSKTITLNNYIKAVYIN